MCYLDVATIESESFEKPTSITPLQLRLTTLPSQTPDEPTVEVQRVRRVVTATEIRVEEIPTEEITEFVFDDTTPVPSEMIVGTPIETIPEMLSTRTVTAPKAKKPTSPWEAPEDLKIVFETMQETQKPVTELVKPEESVTEEIEVLPTKATSTAQLALYETAKPTVTMTFKLPEGLEREGTHLLLRKRMTFFFYLALEMHHSLYYNLGIAWGIEND